MTIGVTRNPVARRDKVKNVEPAHLLNEIRLGKVLVCAAWERLLPGPSGRCVVVANSRRAEGLECSSRDLCKPPHFSVTEETRLGLELLPNLAELLLVAGFCFRSRVPVKAHTRWSCGRTIPVNEPVQVAFGMALSRHRRYLCTERVSPS